MQHSVRQLLGSHIPPFYPSVDQASPSRIVNRF
ncbi:hypothetical protein OA78_2395 [Latilactobacillus curvatus]|nr:hypothetical protein OA78_2395 [Latilactobacillus curvatus]